MLLTGARPLNSALEIDLDFDRALRPPPPPTEEATASLEDMIKRRIAERHFDDPRRSAPPADDLQKELAELDDKRSSKVASAAALLKLSAGLGVSRVCCLQPVACRLASAAGMAARHSRPAHERTDLQQRLQDHVQQDCSTL